MVNRVLNINWRIPILVGLTPIAGWSVPQMVSAHCKAKGVGNKAGKIPVRESPITVNRLKEAYDKARAPIARRV